MVWVYLDIFVVRVRAYLGTAFRGGTKSNLSEARVSDARYYLRMVLAYLRAGFEHASGLRKNALSEAKVNDFQHYLLMLLAYKGAAFGHAWGDHLGYEQKPI